MLRRSVFLCQKPLKSMGRAGIITVVLDNANYSMIKQTIEGDRMTIHEFVTENKNTVVLIYPSLVMWDYFEYVIPLMQDRYHLIIPALPGYDEELQGDFTGVEKIASELADRLEEKGYDEVSCIYGCSMGGAIAARLLADDRVRTRSAVMDGGITP